VTETASETRMPSESVEEDCGPDLRRLAEHGGYKCAGCTGNYHSIRSFPGPQSSHSALTVGQGIPGDRSNRGTVCEDEDSAKELKKKSLKKKSLKKTSLKKT
jgi:hypothetical protein